MCTVLTLYSLYSDDSDDLINIVSAIEGAILGQELTDRCQTTTNVLSISSQCGFTTYFTQLEQVFGLCEAYTIDHLEPLDTSKHLKGGSSQLDLATDQGGASNNSTSKLPKSKHDSQDTSTELQGNSSEHDCDI